MGSTTTTTNAGNTFLKTLQSVLIGARQVEEFVHVVVSSAVEDTLLCVARDYGHDYSVLLKRFRHEVVTRHASGTVIEKSQCRGQTKGGKQCGKRAILHGYCQQHAVHVAEEEAKRRKVQAYAASIPSSGATTDVDVVRLICQRPIVPGGAYRVV